MKITKQKIILPLILIITLSVYWGSLGHGFIQWDDPEHFWENPAVYSLSAEGIKRIFSSTVQTTYIPFTILSYAIEYHFFKYNPFIYHLDNLILHLAVVALIFWFGRQIGLSLRATALAALLFGIHPMHVESVVWITERKDVFYSVFYLLSLNFYWKYLEEKKRKLYYLTIVFGVLSILSKPMALSLPLVFWLCDWYRGRKISREMILEKIPHLCYIIPIAWITYSLNMRFPAQEGFFVGILTWVWTFVFYIQKFFIPLVFLPLYQRPEPVTLAQFEFLWGLCIFIVLILSLFRYRNHKLFLFAFLYYFFSIFFLLRFDNVVHLSIVSDRFMYLPSLGICLWLGVILDKIPMKTASMASAFRKIGIIFASILMVFLMTKTVLQTKLWGNNVKLWDYVIQKSSKNFVAYTNRGNEYAELRQWFHAFNDYNTAIALNPQYYIAYGARGVALKEVGQYEGAIVDFDKVIEVKPDFAQAYHNRGFVHAILGNMDLALVDFNKAIEIDPHLAQAYSNRGGYYLWKKEYGLAIFDLNRALQLNPLFIEAYLNRSLALAGKEELDLALSDIETALRIDSTNINAYVNKSFVLELQHQYDEAIAVLSKALTLYPQSPELYFYRSKNYQSAGINEKALEDAITAKSLGYEIADQYINELKK